MKELLSYIKTTDLAFFSKFSDGKIAWFIKILKEGNFSSEAAFRERICRGGKPKAYYYNLKLRAIKTLRFMLLVAPSYEGSILRKKLETCQLLFITGHQLHNRSQRKEAFLLFKKGFKIAVKYDFTVWACEFASTLCSNTAMYESNVKLVHFYISQVEYYTQNYVAEKKAENYYYQYLVKINKRNIINFSEVNKALEEISKLNGRSRRFQFFYHSFKVIVDLHRKGYHEVIKSCDKALFYFENNKVNYSFAIIQFFYIYKGIAQIALSLYEDAKQSFYIPIQPFKQLNVNFYNVKFYLCINALHAQDYITAYKYYRENRNCKYYFIRKEFIIAGAYLYFLSKNDLLDAPRFRISNFLDKSAFEGETFDIQILIAELLVLLVKDRKKFLERVEEVETKQQHFSRNSTIRAKQFLKMLMLIAKAKFNLIRVDQRTTTYLKNLKSQPLSIGADISLEFIPFERVWEIVRTRLKKKTA